MIFFFLDSLFLVLECSRMPRKLRIQPRSYGTRTNVREIYGLVIIHYPRMSFTNHSSNVDTIPLDVEMLIIFRKNNYFQEQIISKFK